MSFGETPSVEEGDATAVRTGKKKKQIRGGPKGIPYWWKLLGGRAEGPRVQSGLPRNWGGGSKEGQSADTELKLGAANPSEANSDSNHCQQQSPGRLGGGRNIQVRRSTFVERGGRRGWERRGRKGRVTTTDNGFPFQEFGGVLAKVSAKERTAEPFPQRQGKKETDREGKNEQTCSKKGKKILSQQTQTKKEKGKYRESPRHRGTPKFRMKTVGTLWGNVQGALVSAGEGNGTSKSSSKEE